MTIRCDEDSDKDCHTKDNDNPSGEWIKDDTELPRSVGGGAVEINNIIKRRSDLPNQVTRNRGRDQQGDEPCCQLGYDPCW